MSQENMQTVRNVMESFIAGETLWDALDPEIEVHDHDIMDAGEYRGHEGFARWLREWGSAWAEFRIEPEEFLETGPSVVMVFRMRAIGRDSGIAVERQDAMVYRMCGGKIVCVDYYSSKEQALKAVGLEE